MKEILFKLFDATFGVLIRGFQMSLRERPHSVQHQVMQLAINQSAEFASKNFSDAVMFTRRQDLWDFCVSKVNKFTGQESFIAEFGVWKGESINYFAKRFPDSIIYGFDSFEGLEEDWYGYRMPAGTFNRNGKMPKCRNNVKLIKGWFEDTLPSFMNVIGDSPLSILHLDADTYKPTAAVLNALKGNLRKGTVVIFDEFFGYPNFQAHEFRAWNEITSSGQLGFRYIAFTDRQVAVEILRSDPTEKGFDL